MFNSVLVQTDVTCVEVFNNYLAAGVGNFLHIYELPKSNLIKRQRIFEGQNIFGIKPNLELSKLIIYGGKDISLIPFGEIEVTTTQHKLSDWILDAKWIENCTKIVTAFLHNKITIWSQCFTREISVKCEERCILYSAHICNDSYKELLILSGTVFSEVLLWKPFYQSKNFLSPVLNRLKQHKGVIFSIHCNLNKGLICTASDDRSAILWKISDTNLLSKLNPATSSNLKIHPIQQVYGHLSRVFRCLIVDNFFVTAGEDSSVIMWNFEGAMLRKIDTHQAGPVWSLSYDSDRDLICSGGNDGALCTYRASPEVIREESALPFADYPKIIGILKTGNMVCICESGTLYHHKPTAGWEVVTMHQDLQKYSLLEVSRCRKLIGLAGIEGQVYIYRETSDMLELVHRYYLKSRTRIFSFNWIDCKRFLVSQKDGILSLIFLSSGDVNFVQTFALPPIKERWPTCVCPVKDHIVVGDRKGNIHNFRIGMRSPVNSIRNAHNYLGVTNLHYSGNVIISLGRDGVLKRYKLINGHLKTIDWHKTKFSWLAALENNCLISFSGNNFVISDLIFQRILFQASCGGGHRSWDFLNIAGDFLFSFVKQKVIHSIKFNLKHFIPEDVIGGYHIREITCMRALNFKNNRIIVSGGEDTVLRFSSCNDGNLNILHSLKVHLSSVRAICVCPLHNERREYLLFTGGGRAQIICWHLQMQNSELSFTETYNFYEPLEAECAETRIMDLCTSSFDGHIFLFAGCSDGCVKIFKVLENMSLEYLKSVLHSKHCITKLVYVTELFSRLLGTMATDGYVTFWSVADICNSKEPCRPIGSFKIHQSGITSCSYIIKDQKLYFLTGGDDNCLSLTQFIIKDCVIHKVNLLQDQALHCAQITGAYLSEKIFITSSIDQRIVIGTWQCTEDQQFQVLGKYNSVIADPQGLEVVFDGSKTLTLYIYGNGFECITINLQADSLQGMIL